MMNITETKEHAQRVHKMLARLYVSDSIATSIVDFYATAIDWSDSPLNIVHTILWRIETTGKPESAFKAGE